MPGWDGDADMGANPAPIIASGLPWVNDAFQEAADDHDAAVAPVGSGLVMPGYIGLVYNNIRGDVSRTKFRLLAGQDPLNYAVMLAEADRLAPYLAGSLSPQLQVNGFFTEDDAGHRLLDSVLSGVHQGTHGPALSYIDMYSYSWAITGRTVNIVTGILPGNAIMRAFPQRWYVPPLGAKGQPLSSDVPLLQWAAALAVSSVCWADYNGRKASIRPVAPIQSNAAKQRRVGW